MGYTTKFMGEFKFSRNLTEEEIRILTDFHDERHEDMDEKASLYCQWVPNEDGSALVWDQAEKFYRYLEWLQELIGRFFTPWGVTLDGDMTWQGDDISDRGVIHVIRSVVTTEKLR